MDNNLGRVVLQGMTPSLAASEIEERIQREISETLRKLLQEKHLYQSLDVNVDNGIGVLAKKVDPQRFEEQLVSHGHAFMGKRWFVQDPSGQSAISSSRRGHPDSICIFDVPHIKTFCEKCDRIEPFNPVEADDTLQRHQEPESTLTGLVQNFVLSFRCQGCKGIPEAFLVRRVGMKLTICGRSPIEHVEVPKYIPATAKKYVSGAIVAHQSGQTLAALFLLRTAIEQWIRSLGASHEKADQALDWYMSMLPADFKSWTPSLRDIYGNLSDALHKADASATLFNRAKADIEKHFDARRLRELPDPKAPE
jgi:hypothetical protein